MSVRAADVEQRRRLYGALTARNRIVAILRIGIPALGAIMFLALVGQIAIAGLVRDFDISKVSMTSERISVETPRYSGTMSDGTRYVVSSSAASAALDDPGVIDLAEAQLEIERVAGADMTLSAREAQFESMRQQVMVPGLAHVTDSTGTKGELIGMFIDWPSRTISASGAVHFDYASGMTLDATGMTFDPKTAVWTFGRATVVLPFTPGEAGAQTEGAQQ